MIRIIILSLFVFLFSFVDIYTSKESFYVTFDFPIQEIMSAFDVPIPEISVIFGASKINVSRISAYNPVPRQTWGDPNVSSCGPNLEKQIAVSRDLFFNENGEKHLCGRSVSIVTDRGEVFSDYVIWDTMAPRFTNTVDIMIPNENEEEAFAFGVTTGVLIIYD